MLRTHPIRLVVAALLLILILLALPVLNRQQPSSAPSTTAAPTAQSSSQIDSTSVSETTTQESVVLIGIGDRTCPLISSPDGETLMLGEDCQAIESRLALPTDVTLWLSLTLSDQPDNWLALQPVEDDTAPPQLDGRGRFFGCTRTQPDEQLCQVTVEVNATAYRLALPLKSDGE